MLRLFRAGALRLLELQLAKNVFESKWEGGRKVQRFRLRKDG
jgi:hypothetical protein